MKLTSANFEKEISLNVFHSQFNSNSFSHCRSSHFSWYIRCREEKPWVMCVSIKLKDVFLFLRQYRSTCWLCNLVKHGKLFFACVYTLIFWVIVSRSAAGGNAVDSNLNRVYRKICFKWLNHLKIAPKLTCKVITFKQLLLTKSLYYHHQCF